MDFKVVITGKRTRGGFRNSGFIKFNRHVDIKVSPDECVWGEGEGAVFKKSICSRNEGGAAGLAC